MLIALSYLVVACISAACSQIVACMPKPVFDFKWLAGGLDVTAKNLVELQETNVPPERPPARLRKFMENQGYVTRHKLSKAEIATCQGSNRKNEKNG